MNFIRNDGGREAAGFTGKAGDCVARSICIATGLPYTIVYDRLAAGNATQRKSKHSSNHRSCGVRTAAMGIYTKRKWFKDYMVKLGFVWQPTMQIGSGCKVHLKEGEVPSKGRYIVALSKHYAAVIDGVLHDTYDCSRGGTRCLYGYWRLT